MPWSGPLLIAAVAIAFAPAAEAPSPTPPRAPAVAPAAPVGCRETLRSTGFLLAPWPLRPTRLRAGVVCEAPEGVSLQRGPSGLRFAPPARVNCAFGLRLARFEQIVQEEARGILRSPVRRIVQLGTYNCRRMAAY